jgi:hypothetical protein
MFLSHPPDFLQRDSASLLLRPFSYGQSGTRPPLAAPAAMSQPVLNHTDFVSVSYGAEADSIRNRVWIT